MYAAIAAACVLAAPRSFAQAPGAYPPAPRGDAVDELHGVRIGDPFRPLEDVQSPRTRAWIAQENSFTDSWLARAPADSLDEQLGHLWPSGVGHVPLVRGDRVFFQVSESAARPDVVMTQLRVEPSARVLLDSASAHGVVREWSAAPDGRFVAYTVELHDGWRSLRIRDARSGIDGADTLRGTRGDAVAWTRDGRGFFYVMYDTTAMQTPLAPVGAATVRFHLVGRAQREDYVVTGNAAHPEWRYTVRVTDDGQYATIAVRSGGERRNRLWFVDLDDPHRPRITAPIVRLFDSADASYDVISAENATFYVVTTRDAPRGQLVAIDINHPHEANWRGVVRESFDAIQSVQRVGDRFVVHYLHELRSGLRLYALDGTPRGEVELPGRGSVDELAGVSETHELYFRWTSFLAPPSVYRYDLDQHTVMLYREPHVDADRSHIEVRQVSYTGRDGMELPVWVMSARGAALDGSHPALLMIGGADDSAATPHYAPGAIAWVENGGIYAQAAVRGGGEYGQGWRDAGTGDRRSTALDDATAAAEWLVREGYARATRLAVLGTHDDAGIAAYVAVAHPELVGAAVLRDGLYDLVRYPRFSTGADVEWRLGSPDNPRQLRTLLATSPLHIVQPRPYSAVWIEAHDDEDGAPVPHALKLAAALQAAQRSPQRANPILLRVRAGDSRAATPVAQLTATRERLRFLALVLAPTGG